MEELGIIESALIRMKQHPEKNKWEIKYCEDFVCHEVDESQKDKSYKVIREENIEYILDNITKMWKEKFYKMYCPLMEYWEFNELQHNLLEIREKNPELEYWKLRYEMLVEHMEKKRQRMLEMIKNKEDRRYIKAQLD